MSFLNLIQSLVQSTIFSSFVRIVFGDLYVRARTYSYALIFLVGSYETGGGGGGYLILLAVALEVLF